MLPGRVRSRESAQVSDDRGTQRRIVAHIGTRDLDSELQSVLVSALAKQGIVWLEAEGGVRDGALANQREGVFTFVCRHAKGHLVGDAPEGGPAGVNYNAEGPTDARGGIAHAVTRDDARANLRL